MGDELLNTNIYLGGELISVPTKAISFNAKLEDSKTQEESIWVEPIEMQFDVNVEPETVNSLWDIFYPKLHGMQVNQRRLPRKKKKILKKQLRKIIKSKVKLSFLKTKQEKS